METPSEFDRPLETTPPPKPKSGRGGARPGAGRKPKGYVKSDELQDLDKQKARHEKIKADRAELEYRREIGELVVREAVQSAAATALATLTQTLRTIPDTLERKHALDPALAEVVGREIDDALDELASAFELMAGEPTPPMLPPGDDTDD